MPLDGTRFTGLKGPDPVDERDYKARERLPNFGAINVNALPEAVDLEHTCPIVLDQKTVSGCVGWSGVACYNQNQFAARGLKGRKPSLLSPAFAYRECRAIDELTEPGSLAHDWGTYVRNFWKVANKLGVPLNSIYEPQFGRQHEGTPANDFLFPENSIYRRQPQRWVYGDADDRQALNYFRVTTQAEIMQSLADGYAVQVGFTVFRSMYGLGGPKYVVPVPMGADKALGGHAVYIIGYWRTNLSPAGVPAWKIRNSWGREGHIAEDGTRHPNFVMPFGYDRWLQDMWTGRSFER